MEKNLDVRENPDSSILSPVVAQAVAVLPVGWKARFAATLSKFLISKFAPEAMQYVAEQIDTVRGRAIVADEMARHVAQTLKTDPLEVERAVKRFWGEQCEKQINLEEISRLAAIELAILPEPESDEEVDSVDISDDWRRKFTSFAEDVSDPEMQRIWGRILAGEFYNPGSFSFRTLRLLSEIQKPVADLFSEFAKGRFAENAIFAEPEDWNTGDNFKSLSILIDWGLISERAGLVNRPVEKKDNGYYLIFGHRFGAAIYSHSCFDNIEIPIVQFTQSGKELLRLLELNDEASVLEKIAIQHRPKPYHEDDSAWIGRLVNIDSDRIGIAHDKVLWSSSKR